MDPFPALLLAQLGPDPKTVQGPRVLVKAERKGANAWKPHLLPSLEHGSSWESTGDGEEVGG